MTDTFQTVLAILAGFGGAGFIMIMGSERLADLTAEKLLKKAKDNCPPETEKNNYASKACFDSELEIYREISDSIIKLAFYTNAIFPLPDVTSHGSDTAIANAYGNYEKASEFIRFVDYIFKKNATLMTPDIYYIFRSLIDDCKKQIAIAYLVLCTKMYKINTKEIELCEKRKSEISNGMRYLIDELHAHIASFCVPGK